MNARAMRLSAADADAAESHRFGLSDWGLLAGAALGWGASFLFIEIALEGFSPGAIAFLRVLFGALTLALIPAARGPVERSDMGLVAVLGLVWMAGPFLLFAVAQQSIDSSLAGMINASAPLFTAAVAAVALRRFPARVQVAGLLIGLAGVVAISAPSIGTGSSAVGVSLVMLATFLYGCAFNLAAPLQRRNGALPVIWRAQLFALIALLPVGAVGLGGSSFAASSLLAVLALGSIGTGAAFVCFTTLVGRVGPTRSSVTAYFLPIVAIALGAVFLDEAVATLALVGTVLVLAGAYLASRGTTRSAA